MHTAASKAIPTPFPHPTLKIPASQKKPSRLEWNSTKKKHGMSPERLSPVKTSLQTSSGHWEGTGSFGIPEIPAPNTCGEAGKDSQGVGIVHPLDFEAALAARKEKNFHSRPQKWWKSNPAAPGGVFRDFPKCYSRFKWRERAGKEGIKDVKSALFEATVENSPEILLFLSKPSSVLGILAFLGCCPNSPQAQQENQGI